MFGILQRETMRGLTRSFLLSCTLGILVSGALSYEGLVARGKSNKLKYKHIAFTAGLNRIQGFASGQILKFSSVLYNGGNGYDPNTGIFTAPRSGVYQFFFQMEHWQTKEMTAHIVLDNVVQSSAVLNPNGKSTQSTMAASIYVKAGQKVWVKSTGGVLFGAPGYYPTAFSGARLN